MKKTFITGIMGALAIGAFGITGCAVDGAESAESAIGSTSEALSVALNVEFPGQYKIDDHNLLVLGGYDVTSSNAGVTTAGIYHLDASASKDEWLPLKDAANTANNAPLPVALGEVEIVKLSSSPLKLLVFGGRSAKDGAASTFTRILTINPNAVSGHPEYVSWATPGQLPSGEQRAGSRGMPCGTSKAIVFGGAKDKGMETIAGMTAQSSIMVFDPAANSNVGAWSSLRNSDNSDDVALNATRAYPFVLSDPSAPTTKFAIGGGLNASALLSSTDRITVDSSCKLTTTDSFAASSGAMPAALAQGASVDARVTISSVQQDGLAIGGINSIATNQTVAAVAYAYRFAASSNVGAWTAASAPTTARAFPRAFSDGSSVYMIGGAINSGATLFDASSNKVQALSLSGNSWGSETTPFTARVGLAGEYLDSAAHVGFGTNYSGSIASAVQSFQ